MNWFANSLKALTGALAALVPNCRESARLQSDALERPLPFFRRLGLALHLLVCKWCRRYGRQIGFLRAAAQKSAQDEIHFTPATLSPEARERIARALETGAGRDVR